MPAPTIAMDIDPEGPGIIQADFLTWNPSADHGPIAVVGNPPFGKNASKAVEFFNHAAEFSSLIAMIVPRSFEKASVQKRLDLFFELSANHPLPPKSFLFEGKEYSVPSSFQIWTKRKTQRIVSVSPLTHPDFSFVSADDADFAFQRVGVRAGALKDNPALVSPSSHYFIRGTGRSSSDVSGTISRIDFSDVKERSAGNPSIAKSELIALYQERLEIER